MSQGGRTDQSPACRGAGCRLRAARCALPSLPSARQRVAACPPASAEPAATPPLLQRRQPPPQPQPPSAAAAPAVSGAAQGLLLALGRVQPGRLECMPAAPGPPGATPPPACSSCRVQARLPPVLQHRRRLVLGDRGEGCLPLHPAMQVSPGSGPGQRRPLRAARCLCAPSPGPLSALPACLCARCHPAAPRRTGLGCWTSTRRSTPPVRARPPSARTTPPRHTVSSR